MPISQEAIRSALSSARLTCGVEVVYRRGASQVRLRAVPGRREFAVQSNESVTYVQADDFLVAASDLILDGLAVEPARGDVIEADIGKGTEAFAVMPDHSLPAWEWRGPYRSEYRIHTKRVDS